MPIARKSTKPAGITNESGQPEILLEVNGLKLSLTPPASVAAGPAAAAPPVVGDPAEPGDPADGDAEAPSAG
jgi:hypothetical protein